MPAKRHTICIRHRHANHAGEVETVTEQAQAEELEAALQRANSQLANQLCRNWGCRIELDDQVILYTLVRDKSALPGPVRFCKLDAMAIARERNATLGFETAWRVNRDFQTPAARPAARNR